MSNIVDNGNGTVTVSKESLKQLYNEHQEYKEDLLLSVQVIAGVLKVMGIMTKDGVFRKDFRIRHLAGALTGIVTGALTSPSEVEKKFAFMNNDKCFETIMKYAYAFQDGGVQQQPESPTDIEFKDLNNK